MHIENGENLFQTKAHTDRMHACVLYYSTASSIQRYDVLDIYIIGIHVMGSCGQATATSAPAMWKRTSRFDVRRRRFANSTHHFCQWLQLPLHSFACGPMWMCIKCTYIYIFYIWPHSTYIDTYTRAALGWCPTRSLLGRIDIFVYNKNTYTKNKYIKRAHTPKWKSLCTNGIYNACI